MPPRWRHTLVMAAIALGGTGISLLLWQGDRATQWDSLRSQLRFDAQERAAALQTQIDRLFNVLNTVGGLFDASVDVTRREFATALRNHLPRHPDLLAVEWLPRVPHAERAPFEHQVRDGGLRDFRLTALDGQGRRMPAPEAPEYFPVLYAQPRASNQRALGFDAFSRPASRRAMEAARDTGLTQASGSFPLMQLPGTPAGIAFYHPVFMGGETPALPTQRHARLKGYAAVVTQVKLLADTAFSRLPAIGLHLRLRDQSGDGGILLERTARLEGEQAFDFTTPAWPPHTVALEMPGRHWVAEFIPSDAYLQRHITHHPWTLLASGLAITALLLLYLHAMWRMQQRLQAVAHHDALTGLPNRALLHDRLDHALRIAARTGAPAALLYMDLDGFKAVNDRHGHACGDALLRAVAGRLVQALRASDTVARLGGDEFLALIESAGGPREMARMAAQIVETMAAPFLIQGQELRIGVSIGISLHPEDGAQPAELLRAADAAMYRAKQAGRHTFRFSQARYDAPTEPG